MRLRIAVSDPTDGSSREVEFESSPVRIGRRSGNELVLRHSFVSEPHAIIEFDAGGIRIVDLGSRNGTIVDGKAIPRDQPTVMVGPAKVDIGPFMLTISTASGDFVVGDLSSTMVLPPEPPGRWTQPVPVPWPAEPVVPQAPPPAPEPAVIPVAVEEPIAEPFRELVEESFEEATFLWRLWEEGLGSHARDLAGLSSFVEERLLGALDGVRVGLDGRWEELLGKALASEERWLLAAGAHVALSSGPARESLLALMGAAEGARLEALRRGVELAGADEVGLVEARLAQGGPEQLAALVTLRAFRRQPPGPELARLLGEPAPGLRAAGLRAARYVPHGGALGQVELALGDPEPLVGAAAVETGLVLGSRAAWTRCRELARTPSAGGPLQLLGFLGTGRDVELVFAALGLPESRRQALKALAGVGTAQAAEACLEAMSVADDARLAAESFGAITGLDLHAENLVAPEPPGPEEPIPFEEEELDADLVKGPDELLPWPEVEGVRRWWAKHRARFGAGRHVLGKPASLAALQEVLEAGSMRRRRAAALELAIRTGGRHDVETAAFTGAQRRQMAGFAAIKDGRSQPAALAGLVSRI
jgi:uncharacterized protein (TIGR02270 family)